jgi:hypothetical protein
MAGIVAFLRLHDHREGSERRRAHLLIGQNRSFVGPPVYYIAEPEVQAEIPQRRGSTVTAHSCCRVLLKAA